MRTPSPLVSLWRRLLGPITGPFARERERILAKAVKIKGLMPVLMKQRNGHAWTADDLAQIKQAVEALSMISAYLVLFVSPGSPLLLPVLAWWLDRRATRRVTQPALVADPVHVSPAASPEALRQKALEQGGGPSPDR